MTFPEYGSLAHAKLVARQDRRARIHELALALLVTGLLKKQRKAILAAALSPANPFDLSLWSIEFTAKASVTIGNIVGTTGVQVMKDLGRSVSFQVDSGHAINFIRDRAQRFAHEINLTTWDRLRNSLGEGVGLGENDALLARRVKAVMGNRIASTPLTIAKTEVHSAMVGGTLEAFQQTNGYIQSKVWVCSFHNSREAHIDAHGQKVALDDYFHVGGAHGPGPGLMNSARNDINCGCHIVGSTEF
jgi:hypothetical protein